MPHLAHGSSVRGVSGVNITPGSDGLSRFASARLDKRVDDVLGLARVGVFEQRHHFAYVLDTLASV